MTDQDVESFRILRTNLEFLDVDRPITSVLVTSPLPEEGKSTVAASLAAANAAAGKRTLLVECDLRRPSLPERLSINRSPGLSDYLAGQATAARDPAGRDAFGRRRRPANGNAARRRRSRTWPASSSSSPPARIRSARPSCSARSASATSSSRSSQRTTRSSSTRPRCCRSSDTLEIVPLVDSVLLCIRADQTTRDQARAVKEALAHLPDAHDGDRRHRPEARPRARLRLLLVRVLRRAVAGSPMDDPIPIEGIIEGEPESLAAVCAAGGSAIVAYCSAIGAQAHVAETVVAALAHVSSRRRRATPSRSPRSWRRCC